MEHSMRMIKHGMAAGIVALVAGFVLIWVMIGGVSLSPVPVFWPLQLPGTPQGWRMVHMGMMMNGILAILLGLVLRQLNVSARAAAWVSWGTVVAVWGNFCFYVFSMFAGNHGVTLEGNALGPASLAGTLAFLPALAGATSLPIALIILLRARPAQ